MSCEECERIHNIALDKNKPQTVPIAYIRIGTADIALIGCKKHLKMLIDKLTSKE